MKSGRGGGCGCCFGSGYGYEWMDGRGEAF